MQRPEFSLRSYFHWLLSSLATISGLSCSTSLVQASEQASILETLQPNQLAQVPIPAVPKDPPSPATAPQPIPVSPTPVPETPLTTPESSPVPSNAPRSPDETFEVRGFQFEGNTAISSKELAIEVLKILAPQVIRTNNAFKEETAIIRLEKPISISFAQLLQARSAITQHYLDKKYITSGAYIPIEQKSLEEGKGIVRIAIVEGELETINVTGTRRLNPNYISRRIAIATHPPLNQERLIQSLQLLRLNPLLSNLTANLAASPTPGKSILNIDVTEASAFQGTVNLNNGRSPSVGSFRRGIQLSHNNLLGQGDGASVNYTNTNGSNSVDLLYTIPITARNTALSIAYGTSRSTVNEPPFDILGIQSKSRYYEMTLRQPLVQTPNQDLAIGITASRRESETSLSFNDIGPYPLSPGADPQGRTRISTVRFFQEWTTRNSQQVFAFRSQFSLGLNALNSTVNSVSPDSRFFAWRGQAQYVRLMAPDTLLLLRADLQLADRPLLSSEQFGIGGQDSVRGYRQDALSTDSGIFASAEVRVPILRVPQWDGLLQLTPFIDFGKGWNRGDLPNPEQDTLISGGLGLLWRMGDRVTARFEWGIPFISVSSSKRTLQEQGLYFSLVWQLF